MSCCGCLGWMTDFALLLNRLALGAYFVIAGYGKMAGDGGVEKFYSETFVPMLPKWAQAAPWHSLTGFYGHALPYAELATGILLAIGLLGRLTAFIQCLMIVSFSLALYGVGKFLNGPGPFHPNVIFALLAFLLIFAGMGRFSFDRLLFGRRGHHRAGPGNSPAARVTTVAPPPPSARTQPPAPFIPTNDED